MLELATEQEQDEYHQIKPVPIKNWTIKNCEGERERQLGFSLDTDQIISDA